LLACSRRQSICLSLCLITFLLDPLTGVVVAQIPGARGASRLAAEGSAALKEKRFAEALAAFSEAARLAPDEAMIHYLVGYTSYLMGQLNDARQPLERALVLDPKLTGASTVLGLVLHRQGRVADAVKVVEAAAVLAPGDRDIRDLLAKWRPDAELQSRFYEARGAHFSVLFQGPSDDLTARRIVEILEEAYWRIGRTLTTYPVESIPVVLYTEEQFRSTGGAPEWAVGVYDGRIKIPTVGALQQPEALRRTLAHEFTHAVVAQIAGNAAPVWLNEGLAELLNSDDFSATEQQLARTPRRLPHARLERSFDGLPREDIPLAYAQSAVAVKRIFELRGAPAVVSLLRALAGGATFATAFQQSIFMRYDEFVATLARY
jgi:tetratricopeptide (TPR) repeat protein